MTFPEKIGTARALNPGSSSDTHHARRTEATCTYHHDIGDVVTMADYEAMPDSAVCTCAKPMIRLSGFGVPVVELHPAYGMVEAIVEGTVVQNSPFLKVWGSFNSPS